MKLLFAAFAMFTLQSATCQEAHWEPQLLKLAKGKQVLEWFESGDYSIWFAKIKVKNKVGFYEVSTDMDWDVNGIDSSYVRKVTKCIPADYDRIEEFISIPDEHLLVDDYLSLESASIAIVHKKNEKGIIVWYGGTHNHKFINAENFFDEISMDDMHGYTLPVRVNKRWGIYDWYRQVFLIESTYTSIEDLPQTTDPDGFDEYSLEIMRAFNKDSKREEIDLIDIDTENGDGLFKARSKQTHKWGVYQYLGDKVIESVPMKYDSVRHFSWNAPFTEVYNAGKVGFYLSYWSFDTDARQSVPCIYDSFKLYVTEDQITRLAVQRDGKWGWVDWLTGEERSEFNSDTPADLPYPAYKQESWFDE